MDNQQKPEEVMYGRELVLNVGRVFWMAVIYIIYATTNSLQIGIAVCGLGMIIYPFAARLKEKKDILNCLKTRPQLKAHGPGRPRILIHTLLYCTMSDMLADFELLKNMGFRFCHTISRKARAKH